MNGGNNIFIDILRCGARPNDVDIDSFDFRGREKLRIQPGQAEHAEHNHREKKQIGGIAMPRKQFDKRPHHAHLRRVHNFDGNAGRRLIKARYQHHIAGLQTAAQ